MSDTPLFHADTLLPRDPATRKIARELYETVCGLPIVSPHGHTDARWFADNEAFRDPARLLIVPDHYVYRMLYSQGVPMEDLGVARVDGGPTESDPRKIWRLFAAHYHLFRATPTQLWFDYTLQNVFGITEPLSAQSADAIYDVIDAALKAPEFLPRALFERFGIEVLATTDCPLDDLRHHKAVRNSGWEGKVIPAYRPDLVVDPHAKGFVENVARLGDITGEDTATWQGYLAAHRVRRKFFAAMGATATDHGHPSAQTADLAQGEASALFAKALAGNCSADEAELFRAQMLSEMAAMSLEDGLVMQIHPGAYRNHNVCVFERFGADKGGDIPRRTDFVHALKPLLDRYGNEADLTIVLFTLDESAYGRELAPLAGHYPALKLGPPWWFHDSAEGMRRYRTMVSETAGFYNTVGFNDDTRAFLSIPARHDVARRMDCSFLAEMVGDHRIGREEAIEVAHDLAYGLAKAAYKL